MSFKDGHVPERGSKEGRQLERIVDKSPFLKKMRAKSQGESYSEISTSAPSQQYKDNYDKIDWSKK